MRQGQGSGGNQKVLIVLDQFEQWLHARRQEPNTELAQALRQCDGEHVQCVVMVRDDFWLALSRFLGELDIRLVGGENTALIDLFDPIHARSVLAAVRSGLRTFARETVRLQQGTEHLSRPGRDGALPGRQDHLGAACPVRRDGQGETLDSRDAEGRGWHAGRRRDLSRRDFQLAATAPPEHRLHQKAAQAVLKALFPESGTDIKGQMRSEAELRDASGYASRPRDFDDLIRILDPELRLITPTDPEGSTERGATHQAGRRALLPTDPRLSRSLVAGLADPQAAGDPPGAGRAEAGGTRGALERQAGGPSPAFAPGSGRPSGC